MDAVAGLAEGRPSSAAIDTMSPGHGCCRDQFSGPWPLKSGHHGTRQSANLGRTGYASTAGGKCRNQTRDDTPYFTSSSLSASTPAHYTAPDTLQPTAGGRRASLAEGDTTDAARTFLGKLKVAERCRVPSAALGDAFPDAGLLLLQPCSSPPSHVSSARRLSPALGTKLA